MQKKSTATKRKKSTVTKRKKKTTATKRKKSTVTKRKKKTTATKRKKTTATKRKKTTTTKSKSKSLRTPTVRWTTYFTDDNGAKPFKVRYNNNKELCVFISTDATGLSCGSYNKQILNTSFEKVFVGKDPSDSKFNGNSMLFQMKSHKYLFIGSEISEFKIDDDIISYISPMGNSSVPYPYAIGSHFNYILVGYVKIDNSKLLAEDPYSQYYNFSKNNKYSKHDFYKFEKKVIYKRI
jgi:hypothetical protein